MHPFRFVDAVLDPAIRSRFLHLPTRAQQELNMQAVLQKYNLPNVIAGVDGCHIPFLERPRNIPGGRDHVAFINRKGFYSLNAQIVGGMDRRIYDIQLSSPGSFHDAATWTMSLFKGWLETRNELGGLVLGDSAYPLSHYCLTPYDEQESQTSDSKCLFNVRHSQARVEMTENIYGMWKKRFPLIKHIRLHVNNAVRVITASAVLHNMAVEWKDTLPELQMESPQPVPVPARVPPHVVVQPPADHPQVRRASAMNRDHYRTRRMYLTFRDRRHLKTVKLIRVNEIG